MAKMMVKMMTDCRPMEDSGDRVIDSITTSSDEDMEPEPGSEVDISDTDLPKVKEENGIVDLPMKKHLFGGRTDWTGWLGSKSEFFEKLLLYDSNSKHDVNSIVDACKDISKRFPAEAIWLNILSEFNSDNVTKYKAGHGSDDPDDKIEIVEDQDDKLFEGMDISVPGLDKIVSLTQRIKVDYNLYVKFWSLQDYFRTPPRLLQQNILENVYYGKIVSMELWISKSEFS
ncbi:unnamed protein product [Orchesella dallaii]|uniref:Uncharacterized protein n=1 Tax=Orchesella dallaii TaxID=48710 RepID=A0ABP1PTN7_9HEXA